MKKIENKWRKLQLRFELLLTLINIFLSFLTLLLDDFLPFFITLQCTAAA